MPELGSLRELPLLAPLSVAALLATTGPQRSLRGMQHVHVPMCLSVGAACHSLLHPVEAAQQSGAAAWRRLSNLLPAFALCSVPCRPDFGACQQLAHAVVNASVPCSAPTCALGAPQVPSLLLTFPPAYLRLLAAFLLICLPNPFWGAFRLQSHPQTASKQPINQFCYLLPALSGPPSFRSLAASPAPAAPFSTPMHHPVEQLQVWTLLE